MKRLAVWAIVSFMIAIPAFAQDLRMSMDSVRTPDEIVRWFSSEFEYHLTMPDRPQSPAETVALKTGDCDDFATLAASILARSGIKTDIVIIRYRGLDIKHAICIWKEKNGTYNFISNKELQRTGEKSIEAAVAKFYPDYEEIVIVDDTRQTIGVVASRR